MCFLARHERYEATVMAPGAEQKQQRSHNRLEAVLDAAAMLFATRGYKSTTMRDIATEAGMQPGSLYYHFASKQELLQAIYEIAVAQAQARLDEAIASREEPRARFEAAVICHTETMLDRDNYARVMTGVLPIDAPEIQEKLTELRDSYEATFRRLIDEIRLPPSVDQNMLRLFILGAINSSRAWYRAGGQSPRQIGLQIVEVLRSKIA